ncbi:helix-turn-helix domain-containing protein [Tepidimicrobium xylanilyticum]|uniref:helix-turn-helix domain-containing protein n=1 Tax=Tepidimicrobium xylanilyticum TaxID=1123352 RepID=UPI00295E2D2A|nr:helix-turn-helix transcriptional regulator [Tepidimicrobium xylanilyticum]
MSNSNITETFHHSQNLLKSTSDLSTIGFRIKYYRLLNNMKQEELAVKAGLDRATIIRYENNLVEHSINIIDKISHALGVNPTIIYDDYFRFISSDYGSMSIVWTKI